MSSNIPSQHQETHEAPENKKKEEMELKIRNIIHESFSLLVQSPTDRTIVDAFCKNPDATNKTVIDTKIKKIIADKIGNDDYLDYHEKITEQLSDVDKIKKMAIYNLVERQKSEKNFTNIVCRWFSIADWSKKTQIENIAKRASTKDLQLFGASPKRAKQFLISNSFDANNFSPTDLQDFLRDCHINISRLEESEKNTIQSYIETQRPNSALLEILLSHTTNNTEKLHIIEKVTGNISFSILAQYELINKAQQEEIIQKVYESSINEEIRNNLTPLEEWEIKDLIQRDLEKNKYKLSLEDLSGAIITNALLTNNNFITSINSIFDEYAEEEEKANEKEKDNLKTLDEMKNFLLTNISEEQKAKISGRNTDGVDLRAEDSINNLQEGSFIELSTGSEQTVWKITNTHKTHSSGKKWLSFNVLELEENTTTNTYMWQEGKKNLLMPYKDFVDGFMNNLSNPSITQLKILTTPPEVMQAEEALKMQTLSELQEIINQIDENNSEKVFEKWCVFSLKFLGEEWETTEHLRVTNLDEVNHKITIQPSHGEKITTSWTNFIKGISSCRTEMHRLGKMDTKQDFVQNAYIPKRLYKDRGTDSIINAIEPAIFLGTNGKVSMKVKNQDGEWEKEVPVWGFKDPERAAFLQVTFEHNTPKVVEFFYSSDQQELEIGWLKEHEAAKHKKPSEQEKLRKEKKRRKIEHDNITNYEWLLQVMMKKWYTQPVYSIDKNAKSGKYLSPIEQHEKQLKEDEEKALNWNLPNGQKFKNRGIFSALENATTLGDLLVMGKMTKNTIEQHFEKNSKLRSAESLHKLFDGTLGEKNALTRAALKEFTNEVGGLIDGKIDMIRRLKGKEMRIEIQNILLTKPPKAVDILAAAMVTAEMGGHMYPDSYLMDLQGERYVWFEQICLAIGVNPKFEMNRCRAKVAWANEWSAHHPSEEELITQLCKYNQSNKWIQAIGGGPKFWKKPAEWRNGQKEKWTKEAGEYASAGDRAEYAIAKMKSNEFEITLGAIDVVAGKGMWPKEMGIGFVWAASNAPNYVHKDTWNALRNIFYGGNSFHGFYFGKEKASGDLYKNIIDIVLTYRKQLGMEQADKMLADYQKITKGRDEKPYGHNEDLIANLWNFWKKYYSILHPILQGTDPLLSVLIQDVNANPDEREKASIYLKEFGENNSLIFEKIDGKMRENLLSVNATYQVNNSFPLIMKEPPYRVFGPLLSNISFDSVTKDMSWGDRNGIWWPIVVDYLRKYVRDNELFNQNPEFQKKQFLILYEEIMAKLSEKMVMDSETKFNWYYNSGAYKHLKMLAELGFDVSYQSIYQGGWRKRFQENPDAVFADFKNSTGKTGSHFVQNMIHKRFGNLSISGTGNDDAFQDTE